MTHRQFLIMNFILRYQRERGCSPTLRETADAVGVCVRTAWADEQALKAEGYLQRGGYRAERALRVLKPPYEVVARYG